MCIRDRIWPGAVLKGKTVIGSGCVIGKDTIIENSTIGDGTDILKSVIKDSKVGANTHVGPFAYMRPGSVVGSECKVGDFVEIKKDVYKRQGDAQPEKDGSMDAVGREDL